MGRSPCCSEQGLRRGAWTAEEDRLLIDFIKANGKGRWRNIPQKAGLRRCGKSCRLRWLNYLRPDIKTGNITPDEEELIIRLHKLLGNRWSLIAGRLPGRTDNEIKNYWNKTLGKRADQNNSPLSPTQDNSNQLHNNNHDDNIMLQPPATMPIWTNSHDPGKVVECFDGKGEGDNHINDRDNLSEDFMMDFNFGELNCLSDLLNADQPLLFSDELMPDHWSNLNTHGL